MSVIENQDNIKPNKKSQRYEIPAVIRADKGEISFEKALITAVILHPAAIIILLLASFLLEMLGLNFHLLKKPDIKLKDIEFVLVDKEGTPIDKNTKNRSDKNSRAGGLHDEKRPVSLPQTPAPKGPEKKPTPPSPKPSAEKPKVQKPQPASQTKQPVKQQNTSQKTQEKVTKPQQAPKPSAPRPSAAPSTPKPTSKPLSNFNIPVPKSSIPQPVQPASTSPVTSAPKMGASGSTSGSSSPSPSFSPTSSAKSGSASGSGTTGGGGRFSNAYGTGGNNVGNPGAGNPKGAPGIDAIKEPDFGPYMKELQRRIKMNWDPPKGNESKRVILLFSIAKDGRLLNVSVHKSSGLPAADKAAIDAVKLTAPFRPLPPEYKNNSVDIQFTFDYNVFGVSG